MRKNGLKIFTLLAVFLLMSMTFRGAESKLVLNPYYSMAGATVAQGGPTSRIRLLDTDYSHYLALMWNENRAANQTLNFITGAGDRTVTLNGNLTVESASLVNQDLTSDASPSFGGLGLTGNLTLAANSITGTSVDINNAEMQQLSNITANTISNAQWGYLGAMNQGVTTTSNVTFGNVTVANGKYVGIPGDARIEYDSTNHYLKVLDGDFLTDRWINSSSNTFLGIDTAGSGNLAHTAGTEGWYNTAIGKQALEEITTGARNTAIGNKAGDNITTGSDNLIIGSDLDAASATGDYQINIGGVYKGTTSGGTAAAVLDAITFINDTANANMTTGLTINQGAAGDVIFCLKASDVAHGITTQAETDTYLSIRKTSDLDGGATVLALTEGTVGINISGYVTTSDTNKDATALAAVIIDGSKKDGTIANAMGPDDNILVIQNDYSTRFIFDEDGDMFYDGAAPANYDAFDDAAACSDVQRVLYNLDKPKERQLMDFKKYTASELIDMGVISDGGFVSTKRMNALILGAVGQLDDKGKAQAQRIGELESQVTQLKAMVEAQAQQLQAAIVLLTSRQERVQ